MGAKLAKVSWVWVVGCWRWLVGALRTSETQRLELICANLGNSGNLRGSENCSQSQRILGGWFLDMCLGGGWVALRVWLPLRAPKHRTPPTHRQSVELSCALEAQTCLGTLRVFTSVFVFLYCFLICLWVVGGWRCVFGVP